MQEPSTTPHRFGGSKTVIRDTSDQDRVIDPGPLKNKRRFVMVSGGLVVLITLWVLIPGLGRLFSSDKTVARDSLRTGIAERTTMVRDVSAQGKIVAATSPTLYSPSDGTVRLQVHAGQTVTQGQLLAAIDSPELTNRLAGELSSLESAQIGLDRQRLEARRSRLRFQQEADLARLALQAAKRELRRAEDSFEHQVISQHDYEEAVDQLEAAQFVHQQAVEQAELEGEALTFEVTTRELSLQQQHLRTDELKRQVAELRVVSPVDGVVGNLAVEERQAVRRSTPLATVVDLSQLGIELSVPESYGDDLTPGSAVEISWNGGVFPAHLLSISPEVVDARIQARAAFDGSPPLGIKRNQRVSTRVLLESVDNTLVLPRGPFLDSSGGRFAYVINGNLAHRRKIEVGTSSVAQIQILSGIEVGEAVILSSYESFERAEVVFLND